MQDPLSMVMALRRPGLLIRAARHGVADYRREAHLPRILSYGRLPRPAQALIQLMEKEAELNDARVEGRATYSLPRHIDVLIALMGESQVLRAARQTEPETT